MIIPSIDLQGGQSVQLIGGRDLAIEAGDPRPLASRFGRVGEIAVIDLDAALGKGDNSDRIADLVRRARCRVGGGIRTREQAIRWLDAGAEKIIIGTAATPELLAGLPAERVIVALDARCGEVVVEGWTAGTGRTVPGRMRELRGLAGGYLVTFVEDEGRLEGMDLEKVAALTEAAAGASLTVAGGLKDAEQVGMLDAMGVDVQVGMALYSGKLDLVDAFLAPLERTNPQGPWPTVVTDDEGRALGLVWSDRESVKTALDRGVGAYHSRRRGLWIKGETSGNTQELLAVDLDCDRDALRFRVRQGGKGFCHNETWTCWGEEKGFAGLARRLDLRNSEAPAGSYTARLLADPDLLAAKLSEESGELADARDSDHVAAEAADLIYFAQVALARAGVPWGEVAAVLDRRSLKVSRRRGDAKTAEVDAMGDAASGEDS